MKHVLRDDGHKRGVGAKETVRGLEEQEVREDRLAERVARTIDRLRHQRPAYPIDDRRLADQQQRNDDREEAEGVDEVGERRTGSNDEDASQARTDEPRNA